MADLQRRAGSPGGWCKYECLFLRQEGRQAGEKNNQEPIRKQSAKESVTWTFFSTLCTTRNTDSTSTERQLLKQRSRGGKIQGEMLGKLTKETRGSRFHRNLTGAEGLVPSEPPRRASEHRGDAGCTGSFILGVRPTVIGQKSFSVAHSGKFFIVGHIQPLHLAGF